MPKTKRLKYERVKHLPNVTLIEDNDCRSYRCFPWSDNRWEGMKKVLELGCGKGEHSLAFAAADPGKYCLGIDLKSHRICFGAEKAIALGLTNIHFLRARIEQIGELFHENLFQEIWLPFPDPHPKNRAVKFRLSGETFLNAYARVLVPGGTVHLKTDSEHFFRFTKASVQKWGGKVIEATRDLKIDDALLFDVPGVVSAYEQDARARGTRIKYAAFTL